MPGAHDPAVLAPSRLRGGDVLKNSDLCSICQEGNVVISDTRFATGKGHEPKDSGRNWRSSRC